MHIWPCSIPKDSRTHTLTRLRATCQKNKKQNTTQEVDLNRNAISINASWHPHILLYQRGSYGRKCLILINKRSKTLNSSGTEEQFCAHGTGRLSGTPGNIKLINSTKRTAKMDDTDRQTDRRAASWRTDQSQRRLERKRSSSPSKNSSVVVPVHTHSNTHAALTQPKTWTLGVALIPLIASSASVACSTLVGLTSGGQGQRDKMAGGVTVSVAWLRDGREGDPCKLTGRRCGFGQSPVIRSVVFESLQGRGRKLPHASLSQEGALDGLQLGSGLGVLQGRVGGCHRTLRGDAQSHILLRNLQF